MTKEGIELPGFDLLDRLNEHMDVGLQSLVEVVSWLCFCWNAVMRTR